VLSRPPCEKEDIHVRACCASSGCRYYRPATLVPRWHNPADAIGGHQRTRGPIRRGRQMAQGHDATSQDDAPNPHRAPRSRRWCRRITVRTGILAGASPPKTGAAQHLRSHSETKQTCGDLPERDLGRYLRSWRARLLHFAAALAPTGGWATRLIGRHPTATANVVVQSSISNYSLTVANSSRGDTL